jgi:hypothetical protein
MTGPEHYKEAERLARKAQESSTLSLSEDFIRRAELHARLARVALAVLETGPTTISTTASWEEWINAIEVPAERRGR